jgi:hypothetical protein
MRHARAVVHRASLELLNSTCAWNARAINRCANSRCTPVVHTAPFAIRTVRFHILPPTARHAWTGSGGPTRADNSRVGRHDERPAPPPVCQTCHRRFCACTSTSKVPIEPQKPGPEDCCQSTPQCKFCVWTLYEELARKYETATAKGTTK